MNPRYEVVDTDVVITGTTDPGASVNISPTGGSTVTVTADGTGAFSATLPNLPFDQDTAVTVSASVPMRDAGQENVIRVAR